MADTGGTNGNDVLVGTDGSDTLEGLGGDDIIDGRGGADIMDGGTGNDQFYVDSADDLVFERGGEGYDRVWASISYVLRAASSVERLSTTHHFGTSPINLTGNEFAQDIIGNDGDNILNGGGGDDWFYGRSGNDQFYVDSANDVAIERAGEGYDRVWASTSYVLTAGSSIERLSTTHHFGTSPINLTGNEFAQDIIGNDGDNIFKGGGGDDWFYGRSGDDQFYVDSANDVVIERAGEGFDQVRASVSYVLARGSSIEMVATINDRGTAAINLTGNEFSQSIYGNDGNNILTGGGGDDAMYGRAGDDSFIVDSYNDLVTERPGEGFDTIRVRGRSDYALAAGSSIERLMMEDPSVVTGAYLTGNEYGQEIRGDFGMNYLDGKGGTDTLFGGGGADTFLFSSAPAPGNVDTILDFFSGIDRVALSKSVFSAVAMQGRLNDNAFVAGTSAQDADDRIIYDQATGALYYDADGSGTAAAVQFASVQPGTTLIASDIVVFG